MSIEYGVRHPDGRVMPFNSFEAAVTDAAYDHDCGVVYLATDGRWVDV